jgi:hypothetical protein
MRICQLCIHDVEIDPKVQSSKSMFMGRRRPYIGDIAIDEFAKNFINISKTPEK